MKRKAELERRARRARESLVELVKHVFEHSSGPLEGITYQDLAERIGYLTKHGKGHALGMGSVLSEMRRLLDDLSNEWGKPIPHIQSLVGNKDHPLRLPGAGIEAVWPGYLKLTKEGKIDRVQEEYVKIAEFGSRWKEVLSSLKLPPV